MSKIPYIVTIVLAILAGLFAILKKYWEGFVYFVLTSLLLLAVFWGVWQIYLYFTSYKKELEERFVLYRSQKIIEAGISVEAFDENIKSYRQAFNKKLRREKFVKWFIIVFCFAVAGSFVAGMILA